MDVQKIVDEVKLELGGDVVKIEIPDTTIMKFVDKAFRLIKPYVTDTTVITKMPAPAISLIKERVLDVIRIFPADLTISNGREIMFDFETYKRDRLVDTPQELLLNAGLPDIDFGFRFENGILYPDRTILSRVLGIECIIDISPEELTDEKYIMWVERYTLAQCKETLGRIRSKFTSSNLPVENDGERILQEGIEEKQALMAELAEQNYGIFEVIR